ncbi:MAG: DUF389 domain-containing protein [Anaerolineales bacterium]|nr:DUF389 domain-containing protein [Anaerolineales bacterium]
MQIIHFIQKLIHPLTADEKIVVTQDIRESASSSFDFFLLVVLSCSIATLGLITDSPAVIIGAMLVAPLMSPIIGVGMSSITGDSLLARNSVTALLRGAGLAVLLSTIMTMGNARLPFVVLQELPSEVLSRIHPSPIDLAIALAGGLAAAYALTRPNISAALPGVAIATALMPPLCTVGIGIALGRWEAAGGALLLFVTNAITIAFASALVFFLRGFSPDTHIVNRRLPRTLVISALITLTLLVPLTYYSVQFFQQATENRQINEVVSAEVAQLNAELVEMKVTHSGDKLDMIITVRTSQALRYEQVTALQKAIVDGLQRPVSLRVNQVFTEQLNPLVPPTSTSTPTVTPTNTLGPSPTTTPTPLPPTATATFTPTATATPGLGQIISTELPPLQLYQTPDGPVIGQIRPGQVLTLLYGRQESNGLVWIEVMDSEGRTGWIPEIYLRVVTATPSS